MNIGLRVESIKLINFSRFPAQPIAYVPLYSYHILLAVLVIEIINYLFQPFIGKTYKRIKDIITKPRNSNKVEVINPTNKLKLCKLHEYKRLMNLFPK